MSMTEKDMFLQAWDREFQTTMKLLKAYPAERLEYRPHEKNRSARELSWMFPMEEGVVDMTVNGNIDFSGPIPPAPKTMPEILGAYENMHKANMEKVRKLSEGDFNGMIGFPSGPGKKTDMRRADVLWLMLMDMVHHRGQFSVYIRLAGGKVPSIYGPSADEPWT